MVGKSSSIGSEMQLIRNQISNARRLYGLGPEMPASSRHPEASDLKRTKKDPEKFPGPLKISSSQTLFVRVTLFTTLAVFAGLT